MTAYRSAKKKQQQYGEALPLTEYISAKKKQQRYGEALPLTEYISAKKKRQQYGEALPLTVELREEEAHTPKQQQNIDDSIVCNGLN